MNVNAVYVCETRKDSNGRKELQEAAMEICRMKEGSEEVLKL